jgi:hypothetical protein
MERKMYEPTAKQEEKWARLSAATMPTDEEFKEIWKHAHHGKVAGWGMKKCDWILSQMTQSREYQMGLWQGRVDRARGLDYSEERNENTYNLGYDRGYVEFESNYRGWDAQTRTAFDEKYVNC